MVRLCLIFVFCAGGLSAETIVLHSGGRIEGQILDQTESSVRILVATDNGPSVLTFAKQDFARIDADGGIQTRIDDAERLLEQGSSEKAEQSFRNLLDENPRNAAIRMGFASALEANHKYTEARLTLEHYLTLRKTGRSPELLVQLAKAQLRAEEYRDAKRTLKLASDLRPDNRAFQRTIDDLLDMVEDTRSGRIKNDLARDRVKQIRSDRIKTRKSFDDDYGNLYDSEQAAKALEDWSRESNAKLVESIHVEIDAPDVKLSQYASGADESELRGAVSRCTLTVTVEIGRWTDLYDSRKKVLIYGWYFQLKQRYPNCEPMIFVEQTTTERGKPAKKRIARASFDGRRAALVTDLYTKSHRDPKRPAPKRR